MRFKQGFAGAVPRDMRTAPNMKPGLIIWIKAVVLNRGII